MYPPIDAWIAKLNLTAILVSNLEESKYVLIFTPLSNIEPVTLLAFLHLCLDY